MLRITNAFLSQSLRPTKFWPKVSKLNFAGQLRLAQRCITTVQPVRKPRRWPLCFIGLSIAGAYGYWKYLTHHSFPSTVAELLKEGLWATIDGGGHRIPDFRKALAKYIEALQEADRLQMTPWSDEYTGIQVVIADLYERMGLLQEAASMYSEVANTYLIAITKKKIPAEDLDRIITRALRVVLLAGLLMSTDANSFKSVVELLTPYMVMATREAIKKNEELKFLLQEYPVFNVGYLRDIQNKQLPNAIFENCWGSYRDELFSLREMMTGIAAASGEYMQALMIKLKTTQIMLTSGYSTGECLLSAVNIASLMYLQSVNLRFSGQDVYGSTITSVENSTNSDDELPISGEGGAKLSPIVSLAHKRAQQKPTAQSFLNLANNIYEEVLATISGLDQRRTDFIPEAYVMALYGQGVIATSQGNWALAADRLSEARLRARGSQIESLLQTSDSEIAKIEEMKNLTEEELSKLKPSELPTVDVMFWKLIPDIEDLDRPELPEPRL